MSGDSGMKGFHTMTEGPNFFTVSIVDTCPYCGSKNWDEPFVKEDGTIVFVLSGDGGLMNVTEVTRLALKLGVKHATLLDGGKALQYYVRDRGWRFHFHAFNNTVDFENPKFAFERSPVYVAIRRKNGRG